MTKRIRLNDLRNEAQGVARANATNVYNTTAKAQIEPDHILALVDIAELANQFLIVWPRVRKIAPGTKSRLAAALDHFDDAYDLRDPEWKDPA